MRRRITDTFLLVFIFALIGSSYLSASIVSGNELRARLRLYEGMSSLTHEPPAFVTSSYPTPMVSARIPSGFSQEEEVKQIKKVFNLLDVRLLNEAELFWESNESGPKDYTLRFDSREMVITINPFNLKNRFLIKICEHQGEKTFNLLESEIILPQKNIAVFGFESALGIPYFLSFHVVLEPESPTSPEKIAKVGGVVGGVVRGGTGQGAVRAVGDIKPPKLIKMVEPIYPEEAKEAGIEGVVILEVETDIYGRVANIKVLKSIPLLDKAAIDAVRQWVYEPLIIDGQPRGVVFTVTVNFKLPKK